MKISPVGYWSTAIFGNDLASDVRATYRELIEDGLPDDAARLKIEQEFAHSSGDPDNRASFWTAFAATQMELGRLDIRVRDQAIAVIDAGGDLHMWDGKQQLSRRAAFEKLRGKLLGPQKRPVRPRPPKRRPSPVQAGDVFLMTLEDGRLARFRTLALHQSRLGDFPIVELIDNRGRPFLHSQWLVAEFGEDAHVQVVTRIAPPKNVPMPTTSGGWRALGSTAAKLLDNPHARPKRGLFG